MPRPQIVVNVTSTPVRRGADSPTGTAFMAYTAATGPAGPVAVTSPAAAVAAGIPQAVVDYISDCLTLGAPRVVAVRATAAGADATLAEWTAALEQMEDTYGMGQVMIPGVATTAAHDALLAHANTTGRTVLLDGETDATATELAAAAAALASDPGAERVGLIAPWMVMPATGGGTRTLPGSVAAAGLAAREDAIVGHANHAPAGDKGHQAGLVNGATAVTARFTNAELDTLADAGVSVIRPIGGKPTLYGWVSVSDDPVFRQLNAGRVTMALKAEIHETAALFLFRQIDGRGQLYAELEGAIRGLLMGWWERGALYGQNADDAFEVVVAAVNSAETAGRGELHAQVAVTLSQHTERVVYDVSVAIPAA